METAETTWHLPDGQTLRVIANPNPQGGMTWVYENVTERLDLEPLRGRERKLLHGLRARTLEMSEDDAAHVTRCGGGASRSPWDRRDQDVPRLSVTGGWLRRSNAPPTSPLTTRTRSGGTPSARAIWSLRQARI